MTPQLDWDPDADSAQRAARVIALLALDAVVDARDSVRKRDAESVHEFRVALRRLRAWIGLYRPSLDDTLRKRTRRRLAGIAHATTELRDLDVQVAWLIAERKALGEPRLEAAEWIVRSLKTDRKQAWRRFRKVLARDFARSEHDLRRELTRYVVTRDIRTREEIAGMRAVTTGLMGQQAEALATAFARIRSPDDTKRLHHARIVAKRTRYVLEALAPHQPALSRVSDDLARFQDVVGELRDAQLLAHRVTHEVTSVAAERTALVASELVYRPAGVMDFSRIVTESPFDASLSLLFALLRDRISAASRTVSASLHPDARRRLVSEIESAR
ncbi:MAG: CHAD domain-containing protein [Gemmatimonadaceae bacterium]